MRSCKLSNQLEPDQNTSTTDPRRRRRRGLCIFKSIFISEYPAHYVTQSTNNKAQRLIHYKKSKCFWLIILISKAFSNNPNKQKTKTTLCVCKTPEQNQKSALQCMPAIRVPTPNRESSCCDIRIPPLVIIRSKHMLMRGKQQRQQHRQSYHRQP